MDCSACQAVLTDADGRVARPRMVGEEVSADMCTACPYIRTEPKTFRFRPDMRALFERWRLWREFGAPAPRNCRETDAYRSLGRLAVSLMAESRSDA